MSKIKQLMRKVVVIEETAKFIDAVKSLLQNKTNSLVVVNEKGEVTGLLNSGNIIKEVIPDYLEEDSLAAHFASEKIFVEDVLNAKDVSIKKFMIKNPMVVRVDDSVEEVAVAAMSNNQLRVPVVDENNKPIGLITRTEIKVLIGEILGIKE